MAANKIDTTGWTIAIRSDKGLSPRQPISDDMTFVSDGSLMHEAVFFNAEGVEVIRTEINAKGDFYEVHHATALGKITED